MHAACERGDEHRVDKDIHHLSHPRQQALVQHDGEHQRDLHHGIDLAGAARQQIKAPDGIMICNSAEYDDEIASDHDGRQPQRQ